MTKSFFGTDGVRGPVGIEPITPTTIVHLGWALGTVIKKYYGAGSVLIGKDTRVSGYLLESSMEAGLSSSGDVMGFSPGIVQRIYALSGFRLRKRLLASTMGR